MVTSHRPAGSLVELDETNIGLAPAEATLAQVVPVPAAG
jgi:hypothetical protein